jgi:hypothetical protein
MRVKDGSLDDGQVFMKLNTLHSDGHILARLGRLSVDYPRILNSTSMATVGTEAGIATKDNTGWSTRVSGGGSSCTQRAPRWGTRRRAAASLGPSSTPVVANETVRALS